MSTWQDNGYRFNLAQILARYTKFSHWKKLVSKIDDSLSGGTAGDYVFPPATDGSKLVDSIVYQKIFYDTVKKRKITAEQDILIHLVEKADRVVIGMPALYNVYSILHDIEIDNLHEVEFETDMMKFYDHVIRLAGSASYNQAANYVPFIQRSLPFVHKTLQTYGKIYRTVQQMMTMHRQQVYRMKKKQWSVKMPVPHYGLDLGITSMRVVHTGGMMILYQEAYGKSTTVYILDYAAQARLYQLSASLMYVDMYAGVFSVTGKQYDIKTASDKYLKHIITNFKNVTPSNAQILCKCYKKSYDIFLAILAGRANKAGAIKLVEEYTNSTMNDLVPLKEVLAICYSVDVKHSMEIARLFKVLPAPDYDMGQCVSELYKKHMNPVPHSDINAPYQPRNSSRKVEVPTFEGLRLYMRYLWISYHTEIKKIAIGSVKAEYMKEAWVLDYTTKAKLPPVDDLEWVDKIDLTATAPYITDTKDSVLNLKDKVLCYDSLEENMQLIDPNPMLRSQVTRLLVDDKIENFMPDPYLNFEHVHRIAPKPEAHKDVARMFFIGNLKGRRTLAEVEHNIGWVCRELPGYAIGKSVAELKTRMHELSTVPDNFGAIFLNTDVEGWSPRMNSHIQQMSLNFWAELFARPAIANYGRIWLDSEVVMNKNGFMAHYTNKSANFEGYNGKMLTYMHLAVIAYATRIARQRIPEISPASILAFIDDVAARVICPKDKVAEITPIYYDSLNAVYEAVGLKLDRFKSIVSNTMSVFLNEIYLSGAHLTYGSRAAVRIGTIIRSGTDTIVDMIEATRAAAEGMIKAGAPHYTAYAIFAINIAWTHFKWDPGAPLANTKFAFFQFVPRIFGGYGIATVLTIASNLASNPVTEGIAIIQEISHIYPDFAPLFKYVISSNMVEKSDTQILLNTGGLASSRAIINNGRTARDVERAITKFIDTSAIGDVLRMATSIKVDEFAHEMVEANNVLDVHTMTKFVASTPIDILRAVSRKFKSSQSIKSLIGHKSVSRIAKANRIDVAKVNYKVKHT